MKQVFILLLAGAAFTMNACSKSDKPAEPENKELIMLGIQGYTSEWPVNTNGPWSVEIPADVNWLEVDQKNGIGNATLTFKCIKANTGSQFQTEVKLMAGGQLINILIIAERFYSSATTAMLAGNSFDDIGEIIATPDGGFLIVGSTSSNTGSFANNPDAAGGEAVVMKYDRAGSQQWKKYFGGNKGDEFAAAALTPDGGYVLLGESMSTNGDFSTNKGNTDIWVQKIDQLGNGQWMRLLGSKVQDSPGDILVAADGSIYLSGLSAGNDGDFTGTHGNGDILIAKLQANGEPQWKKCVGGSEYESGRGKLAATADGGVIFCGFTYSTDGDLSAAGGSIEQDGWLCKLTANGTIGWSKKFGGGGDDTFVSMIATADGGFVAAGVTGSENLYGQQIKDGQDAFALKINGEGIRQWSSLVDAGGAEAFYNLCAYKNNGFLLTGSINEGNGLDGLLCLIDGTGKKLWTKSIGGSNIDLLSCIASTTDNNIITGGITTSNDGDIPSNAGDFDIFIHRFQ